MGGLSLNLLSHTGYRSYRHQSHLEILALFTMRVLRGCDLTMDLVSTLQLINAVHRGVESSHSTLASSRPRSTCSCSVSHQRMGHTRGCVSAQALDSFLWPTATIHKGIENAKMQSPVLEGHIPS